MKNAEKVRFVSEVDIGDKQVEVKKPFKMDEDNQRRFIRLEISAPVWMKSVKDCLEKRAYRRWIGVPMGPGPVWIPCSDRPPYRPWTSTSGAGPGRHMKSLRPVRGPDAASKMKPLYHAPRTFLERSGGIGS